LLIAIYFAAGSVLVHAETHRFTPLSGCKGINFRTTPSMKKQIWTSGLRRTSKTGARAITSGQRLAGDRARYYKCRWRQYTRQSFDATSRHERKQFVDLRSVSVSIPWRSAVIMGADGNLAPHRTCQQWRHTGVIHRQRIRILTSASPAKPRRCTTIARVGGRLSLNEARPRSPIRRMR